MFGDGSQQFHCFQMLDEALGLLNTSANIVGFVRSPLKNLRAICILIVVSSLNCTAPSQRIQIITSIEVLDKMLDEMLGHLNISPNICKIC